MIDRYLSKSELSEILSLSCTTIWRMERRGELPSRRRIGSNRVGWLESEIRDWIADRPPVVSDRLIGGGQ